MRILLTGGGSGGHIFPLVAVLRKIIEILNEKGEASPEFLFVGPDGFSKEVFKGEGIRAKIILSVKIRRYFSFQNIVDAFKLPVAFVQAYIHTFLFMPDVIFAKGGYGSVLVVLWGWIFRIPIVIHESDAVPGMGNRILAKLARVIIVSFDATVPFFAKRKTLALGNPIRDELFKNARKLGVLPLHSGKPIIFVLGGSQGAQEINELMLGAADLLVKKYEIIHQCGDKNFETVEKGLLLFVQSEEERALYHLYSRLSEDELHDAYLTSSVIVSRAGSGAIFEIAAARKPSILIPYSAAASNHQEKNAHLYAETGAALVLEGENLTPHLLISSIEQIVDDAAKVQVMSEAASRFAKPDAAKRIAEELLKFA
jgi:UDP-N-acetylglucosamine--N-acetylmuramyl-(pentapeptide) pyrophosphoryl-undecaprenol N-acetylglucosamine transferase